jgi:aminopeptidase N
MQELEKLTGLKWPSSKTELVFVNQFLFSAMENHGLIILDEDKYLNKLSPP